jgi:hypothetical protein
MGRWGMLVKCTCLVGRKTLVATRESTLYLGRLRNRQAGSTVVATLFTVPQTNH